MTTRIQDKRLTNGTPIRDMPPGTWFVAGLGLFLKASHNVCVDVAEGKAAPFNEFFLVQAVEVEVVIRRNVALAVQQAPTVQDD